MWVLFMFFSSIRERRLWGWTTAVLIAIFSSLGLAQTAAGFLRAQGLITAAFWLGLILIGTAVLALGIKARPGGVEIGIGLGIIAVYLIALLRMTIPEERSHLIEYSVLALLIHEALIERSQNGRFVPSPPLLAILITSLLGTLDELIQLLLPNRIFDPRDILFNILAAIMAISGRTLLTWARKRWPR